MSKHQNSGSKSHGESLADRTSSAFSQFGETASSKIDNSPLIALAGGIAIGALIAAVLRQTERETELLQPVGSKVTDAGRAQIDKLREAGKAKVDELAGDKLRDFFGYSGGSANNTAS